MLYRTGALKVQDVEKDYSEDEDFLLAKLKKIKEESDVRMFLNHVLFIGFLQFLVLIESHFS